MATGEAKWTAVDGRRVRYREGGRRSGPDVLLLPMQAGLAAEEAVWSAIVTVGRAVAIDEEGLHAPCAMASFVARAIDVLRLRHPHLAASGGLRGAALTAALNLPDALESLILAVDDASSDSTAWTAVAGLLPRLMLPTLIIATHPPGPHMGLGGTLRRCRVEVLEGEAPWSQCAAAVCAWISGEYRSFPPGLGRP